MHLTEMYKRKYGGAEQIRIQYDCAQLRRQKPEVVESTEVESSDTVLRESYL